jgi:hypothetical protein
MSTRYRVTIIKTEAEADGSDVLYEQSVEALDMMAVIAAVNRKVRVRPSRAKQPEAVKEVQ